MHGTDEVAQEIPVFIVDVPYVFEATGLLSRGRSAKKVLVHGSLPVEIEEAPGDQAILVAYSSHQIGDDRREFRQFEGHFWEPVRHQSAVGSTELGPAEVRDLAGSGKQVDSFSLSMAYLREGADILTSLDDAGFREIHATTRFEEERRIRERASHLLMVDGRLFVRSSEPLHLLVHRELRIRTINTVGGLERLAHRADQADRLLATLEHNIGCTPGERLEAEAQRLTVLRPDLLTWNRARNELSGKAAGLVGLFRRDYLGDDAATHDLFDRFVTLRTIVAAGAVSDEDLDRLADAMKALCDQFILDFKTTFPVQPYSDVAQDWLDDRAVARDLDNLGLAP